LDPLVYDRMEMKIIVNRLKRLIYLFTLRIYQLSDLFNYKYPIMAYMIYGAINLIILLFDMNYFFVYLILTGIILMLSTHPYLGTKI